MEIKQMLIPSSMTKTRPKIAMKPRYLTIHTTGNTAAGANALAHAKLQANGNSRTASWHFTCDDKEIYQSVPTNEVAWHAGDGGSGTGNRQSIGIEICINSDGNFIKAKENAVWLIRYLMDKLDIPITNVVPHQKWSGKDCPHEILPTWSQFINQIKAGGAANVATSKTVESMYDLSYMKDYKLVGIRSSKHTNEITDKVSEYMEANANFVLLTKRGADLRALQKTLNAMYPDSK